MMQIWSGDEAPSAQKPTQQSLQGGYSSSPSASQGGGVGAGAGVGGDALRGSTARDGTLGNRPSEALEASARASFIGGTSASGVAAQQALLDAVRDSSSTTRSSAFK